MRERRALFREGLVMSDSFVPQTLVVLGALPSDAFRVFRLFLSKPGAVFAPLRAQTFGMLGEFLRERGLVLCALRLELLVMDTSFGCERLIVGLAFSY